MTVSIIPIDNTIGSFDERVTLDGVVYSLAYRFNSRMNCWLMNVADSNGVVVLAGIPVRESWSITVPFIGKVRSVPYGAILAMDQTGKHTEPDGENFGVSVILFYRGIN